MTGIGTNKSVLLWTFGQRAVSWNRQSETRTPWMTTKILAEMDKK